MAGPTGVPSVRHGDDGLAAVRHGRELPAWRSVLAVVAHPDDESFGLGAVIGALTSAGLGGARPVLHPRGGVHAE